MKIIYKYKLKQVGTPEPIATANNARFIPGVAMQDGLDINIWAEVPQPNDEAVDDFWFLVVPTGGPFNEFYELYGRRYHAQHFATTAQVGSVWHVYQLNYVGSAT